MKKRKIQLNSFMEIFIYTSQTAHGIIVIVDNLVNAFQRKGVVCSHITTLNGRSVDDIIISYGVKEANEVLQKGFRPFATFMADAITLGYRNKIAFYLRHLHFFHYDFFYSLYGYMRYRRQERNVARTYKNAIFVSDEDIKYFKENYSNSNCHYYCVANGAPEVDNVKEHVSSSVFRIGLLSQWGLKSLYEESNWFVRSYWKRYYKTHKNCKLVVAGRGQYSKKLASLPGVDVVGAVPDLADFFANIDVSLLLCPKGCGILNRVLDSFMYRVPVVGYEASFSGFPDSDAICFKFKDYRSFELIMDKIIDDGNDAIERAKKAYEYVRKNHNWENNYTELVESLIKEYEISSTQSND